MFSALRSLHSKILLLFVTVLITVAAIVAVTTLQSAYRHSSEQLLLQFKTSKQVLFYKLLNEADVMRGMLETASKDFNTKQLIAGGSEDPESLRSALQNQQNRAHADFVIALDGQFSPLASTAPSISIQPETNQSESLQRLRLVVVDNKAFLVEQRAVKFIETQPKADAWLIMGVALDKLLGKEIRSLIAADLSVMNGNNLVVNTSDDIGSELSNLLIQQPRDSTQEISVNGHDVVVYRFHIQDDQGLSFIFSVGSQSAYLNFRNLTGQLLGVLLLAILIAFATSFYIAKGITRPLRALAQVAQRIKIGDYLSSMPHPNSTELGDLSSALISMREGINEREQKIEKLAYFDELTGLPNRNAFINALAETIDENPDNPCAVVMIDLDRFTDINDTLGHDFGDELLKNIAYRMSSLKFNGTSYAHVGGDEFMVLLTDFSQFRLEHFIDQFSAFFEQPFEVNDIQLDVDASLGAAIYKDHADTAYGLMQCADIALNKCKSSHVKSVIYDDSLNTHSVQRLSLMSELRSAIEDNQLTLYYQPKLNLQTNRVENVECLVRWIHPEHGFIGPDDFIPLAEQTGAIRDLTHWALRVALTQHCAWREQGIELVMAINISAIDLVDLKLPAYVSELLSEYRVDAKFITLEVTESAVMAEPEQAIKALHMLQRMGISLSIDDFGTGFSSMAQLKKMPVSELKIDKSFVLELSTNKDDATIVKSTTDLAHNLGLKVVAEGVEDEIALQHLKDLQVEMAQGFFIAKPLPVDQFDEWLKGSEYFE